MSDRRALAARAAPLLLLLLLAGAVLLPVDAGLSLPSADDTASADLVRTLDTLPADAVVLIGFDPDIGTYAEIRPTVRAVLADLLGRGATLAFISLTPEGRALAIAELERMERLEVDPEQLEDLGFLPGAEAGLVALSRALAPGATDGLVTGLPVSADLAAARMAFVVGGIDIGPRSWVEQVAPRTEGLELVAVAPAVLLPELQPYLASGQLAALVGTPRDGAAYRAAVDLGALARLGEPRPEPSAVAVVVGILAAVVLLGHAFGARLARLNPARPRETR